MKGNKSLGKEISDEEEDISVRNGGGLDKANQNNGTKQNSYRTEQNRTGEAQIRIGQNTTGQNKQRQVRTGRDRAGEQHRRERERERKKTKNLELENVILKDSSVRSIWTYLTASP